MTGTDRSAVFAPDPRSARAVREFVREACQAWEVPADAPVLMVGELATNAITHARTEFSVTARRESDGLRVEVSDGDPRTPALANVTAESERGRGLLIVTALARRWGTEPFGDGKKVWFEI